ncbi:MAG TPA: ligase-associated DNA damage response exonuclease [Phycisphaerales bacterium]|nr:ligase-associated DNA damage response exonuclease [Phycisphaerales bacterium]
MPPDLITLTPQGLWCEAGGFHIDPWEPVDRAVITHAHSDHARPGSASYLTSPSGAPLLRIRMGPGARVEPLAWGERLAVGAATVSLHPAGHVLGSCQVRVEAPGQASWLITGDYKLAPDATCEAWEPVRADVMLTESTFGLPIYHWAGERDVLAEINGWWAANREHGRTSMLLAYSLGKAQRVLAGLDPSIGPIGMHGAIHAMNDAYGAAGVILPAWVHANKETAGELRGAGLIVAPPSAAESTWARKFAGRGGMATGMASGWMAVRGRRRWRALDRGFVLSDHADWEGLNEAVRSSGAERIGVTHGYAAAFARWLRERGLETFVVPTRFEGEDAGEAPAAAAEAGAEPADGEVA